MKITTKPLPEDVFLPEAIVYEGKHMYISCPKTEIDFDIGTHYHDGYEFIIPLKEMPYIEVDGKKYMGLRNHIIPINPWQGHGAYKAMSKNRFINILIDRNFVNKITRELPGKEHLIFVNGLYRISGRLQSAIKCFMEEVAADRVGRDIMLEGLTYNIAVLLIREIKNNINPCSDGSGEDHSFRIRQVISYIHENYRKGCPIDELSQIAQMSKFHLIRVFKACTGKTPHEYILDLRLERGKLLLGRKELTTLEICYECGFNNVSHFNRIFKKRIGVTPSEYRKMIDSSL